MRSKFKWIFTLLMALTMQFSFAQEKTITGVVSDASGPLPGANVVIKGTSKGVSTGFDGKYSIKAKEGEVLVFSFMGNTTSKTVGTSSVINAIIQDGPKQLGEVVVTAVGIKKKQDAITSSNKVVKAAELNSANNPNAISALTGKVSGLQIVNTSNGVNQTNKILLRAPVSLTSDNQALVVIDNAIADAATLSRIPPENIDQINVIKGAQGAALYGSNGRNGVIMVTTKKGTKGEKINISLNSTIDFEEVSYVAQRQEKYGQGWSGTHVSYENGAWGSEMDGSIVPVGIQQANGQFFYAPYSPIKDNIKAFYNTGLVTQNNLTMSGGNEDAGFFNFSVNRQTNDFIVKGDELKRNAFSLRAGKKIGKFTVDGNFNYANTITSSTTQTLLQELYQAATNIPIDMFENSGNEGAWTSYYRNPYWMRDNIRFNNDNHQTILSANLNYKINKNINVNYLGNMRLNNGSDLYYRNGYVDKIKLGGGDHSTVSQFDTSTFESNTYYGDLMINFDYKLTEDLSLKANLGQNITDYNFKINTVGGDNLVIPGFYNINNITGAPRTDVGFVAVKGAYNGEKFGLYNGVLKRRGMALFANVDFSYKDFLFLNLTARNDWESRLTGPKAPTNNYFYPSAGLSFVPTKLEFLKGNSVLNYAKLMLSYTKVGNAFSGNSGIYAINETGTLGTGYPFGSNSSFVQFTNVTDPSLRPENTETIEFAGNFDFFNDRLSIGGAYYTQDNSDLITQTTTSTTSGLFNLTRNIGRLETNGFEIDLTVKPIYTPNFKWSNTFGFSTYKTTVKKVTDESKELEMQNNGEVGIFAVEGEEFPLIKGTAYKRDPLGRVIIDAASGNPLKTDSYAVLGKATPDYILNYSGFVDYKGLRLGIVMDYRTGHQFYSGTKDWLAWSGHLYESALNGRTGFIYPNSVIETSPGVYTENTSVVTGGSTYSSFLSYFQDDYANVAENSILDATALKIRELSLSYTLPNKLIEKMGLTSLKIGVNARNPFVFLPKENRGYSDPEFSNATSGNPALVNANAYGISPVGRYPQTRTFGFNINVAF